MVPEIKNLLEKASVSLLLDSYDAIFSDFDPRPYGERALSDDFLAEAKKATRETKAGNLELRFLIPQHLHNAHEDAIVKERLHRYFKKHLGILEAQTGHLLKTGVALAAAGVALMFFSSLIAHYAGSHFGYDFLRVIFEPAGWFMVWFGLDQIFYLKKKKSSELDFYRKMTKAEIGFDVY